MIGAAFALLLFRAPFGFVALLGIIALAGMIMRNSVILVDQIEQDEKAGRDTWSAIVESTVRRFRPILLTAAAAILAMIPLSRNDFFGPQAIAIMGGLTVATALTIFFSRPSMPRGSRSNGRLRRRAQRLRCCFIQHIMVRQRNSRLLFREVSHESLAFNDGFVTGPAGAERLHADARQRPRRRHS